MKPNTDINSSLLTLLILYVKDQEELYEHYHDGFIYLAEWLYGDDPVKVYSFPTGNALRICSACGWEHEEVVGGQVLEQGCAACQGQRPYKDRLLRLIWKFRFCEILRMNEAYFDYHLVWALRYVKAYGM